MLGGDVKALEGGLAVDTGLVEGGQQGGGVGEVQAEGAGCGARGDDRRDQVVDADAGGGAGPEEGVEGGDLIGGVDSEAAEDLAQFADVEVVPGDAVEVGDGLGHRGQVGARESQRLADRADHVTDLRDRRRRRRGEILDGGLELVQVRAELAGLDGDGVGDVVPGLAEVVDLASGDDHSGAQCGDPGQGGSGGHHSGGGQCGAGLACHLAEAAEVAAEVAGAVAQAALGVLQVIVRAARGVGGGLGVAQRLVAALFCGGDLVGFSAFACLLEFFFLDADFAEGVLGFVAEFDVRVASFFEVGLGGLDQYLGRLFTDVSEGFVELGVDRLLDAVKRQDDGDRVVGANVGSASGCHGLAALLGDDFAEDFEELHELLVGGGGDVHEPVPLLGSQNVLDDRGVLGARRGDDRPGRPVLLVAGDGEGVTVELDDHQRIGLGRFNLLGHQRPFSDRSAFSRALTKPVETRSPRAVRRAS